MMIVFSHFNTITVCVGQTKEQTDRQTDRIRPTNPVSRSA